MYVVHVWRMRYEDCCDNDRDARLRDNNGMGCIYILVLVYIPGPLVPATYPVRVSMTAF